LAKVLITGGAGFIASNIADKMIELGHSVVIVDDLSSGFEYNINPKAKFFKMDIRDPKLKEVFQKEKPEYIFHHAAQMDVRKSVEDPLFDADVNIKGGLHVIMLALENKVKKFIYASTGGAVYGEPEYLPVDEKHPVNAICQYGISKHTLEHYLFLYNYLYGMNYTILRYPNVFGPRQNPHGEAGVNAIFIGMMLDGQTPKIFGDGKSVRDYIYVGDVVEANVIAMTKGDKNIYNLGWGRGISVNEIYAILQKLLKFKNPPIYSEARAGEIERVYLDASKAKKELGWAPKVTYEEGLQKTIDWFREKKKK
jgi:UDP-glucose 4-epimerase